MHIKELNNETGEAFNIEWLKNLDNKQLEMFFKQSPIIVNGLQLVMDGDGIMGEKRIIGDIKNNTFGPNTSIQSDYVTQTNTEKIEIQNALNDIEQSIESLSDKKSKEDAFMYFDMLIKYIEENKPSKVKSCLTKLKEIIGTTASIMTIASHFGITL